jgi:hypothetical protein
MMETFGKLGENLLKYIDLIKSNLFPISATLSIFTLLIIFLPESIFSSLHTDEIRNNNIAFIGVIAVVSTF